MADVFVSYANEDRAIAEKISRGLEGAGLSVWWDRHIQGGVRFRKEIDRQLGAAKVVLVLWSAASRDSEWVCDEAQQALDEKKLIPLRLDGIHPPLGFRQAQSLDFSDWGGDPKAGAFTDLVDSARHFVDRFAALAGHPRVPMVHSAQRPGRKNSICVLPFVNMSGDAEQEYFSDGISEDIITDLSKVSALFVIARNTAFTFKAKSVDVTQVARQLDISHVLEGSVRKAGGRVRITAQLIDGATGGHVWAERYDRDLNDIFAVQDEISSAIVSALKLKLLPREKASLERRGTTNVEAYDLYLRGTRPAFADEEKRARIALLEAATRLAPDYSDAWGELAKARVLGHSGRTIAERNEDAAAAGVEAERALALDPDNIAALGARFYLLPTFGPLIAEKALVDRMEKIAPANIDVLTRCAYHLGWVGRMRAAIEVEQRAYEIDPLDPYVLHDRARALFKGGRYAEARRCLEDVLSRWPDHRFAASSLVELCVHTQDWATIDALLAKFPFGDRERGFRWYPSVMRDRTPESRGRAIEAARRQFETFGTANFFVLQVAAQLGASDEAYAIALRARFAATSGMNSEARPYVFNSMFPEFRRDPRFVKLCARCGLVDYWLTTQHWPDCVDEVAPYYDFKAECERVAAGPPLTPANQTASPAPAV